MAATVLVMVSWNFCSICCMCSCCSSDSERTLSVHIVCLGLEMYMKAPEEVYALHVDTVGCSTCMGFDALVVYDTDMDIAQAHLVLVLDILVVVYSLSLLRVYIYALT